MLSSNTQVLIAFLVRRGSLAATHHQRGKSPKHISRRKLRSSRTPTVPASTSSSKQCSRTSKRVSLNLTQSSGATYRKYCSRKSADPFRLLCKHVQLHRRPSAQAQATSGPCLAFLRATPAPHPPWPCPSRTLMNRMHKPDHMHTAFWNFSSPTSADEVKNKTRLCLW